MKRTGIKRSAQGIFEFVLVFAMLIGLFFALIEFSLFWREKHTVETIANEILANAQLHVSSSTPENCTAANVALETLVRRRSALGVDSSEFEDTINEDGVYTFSSMQKTTGAHPRVSLIVNCLDVRSNKLSILLKHRYRGVMLFVDGFDIFSAQNWEVPKF